MEETLPGLLHRQARNQPDHTAVVFMDQQLSYAQLDHRASTLAAVLQQHGIRKGDRVGIYANKSIHLAVALYGIMAAGAAYVPLDPSSPPSRTATIINDCDITVLITANSKVRNLQQICQQCPQLQVAIGLDGESPLPLTCLSWQQLSTNPVAPHTTIPPHNTDQRPHDDDLAYIIYTSGSTGDPKGIMHTHRSGMSFARWAATEYKLSANDRLSNHAPLHFDLSIFDYFAALVAGAATVIIPEEYTRLPASYSQLLSDQQITVLFTVPFALIQLSQRGELAQRKLNHLRWIIFGGEPMPVTYLQQLQQQLNHCQFDNMYGPAEINGCCHHTVTHLSEEQRTIPIGPICNIANALIVDHQDHCVGQGTPGELLVQTPTMMLGYWGQPDLNQQVFYRRFTPQGVLQVFYRTGDLVRQDSEGQLWFVGRKDRQIKIRGYRVELDEIEATLTNHHEIEEAAVFCLAGEGGCQQIAAALIWKNPASSDQDDCHKQLLKYLKQQLPWYAIPAQWHVYREFPRTVTDKIDRRQLKRLATSNQSMEPSRPTTPQAITTANPS